jgi:hypothetical protein
MIIDIQKINRIYTEMVRDKQESATVDGMIITIKNPTTPDVDIGMWGRKENEE